MNNNIVLDIIISLTKAAVKDDKVLSSSDKTAALYNCKYLLGQILRQYQIPQDHYYISKAAKTLWENITSQDVHDCNNDQRIKCDRANHITVYRYVGAAREGTPFTLEMNQTIKYNDIFHNEHIIPIKVIEDELFNRVNPNQLSYDTVKDILGHIYICKITKEEDRSLPSRYNRPFNLCDNIKTYEDKGITLMKITEI